LPTSLIIEVRETFVTPDEFMRRNPDEAEAARAGRIFKLVRDHERPDQASRLGHDFSSILAGDGNEYFFHNSACMVADLDYGRARKRLPRR
jgi:hypothetical protein